MRIFITGATGYIGSAVTRELAEAGHQVTGLTRSPERSSYLEDLGAEPVVGDLRESERYRAVAGSADALIHLAAEHTEDQAQVDRVGVDTLLEATRQGEPDILVYTSGCFVLGETGDEAAHEDAALDDVPDLVAWRPAHEDRVLEASSKALATAVIRPGMVYGGPDGAFADFFASAERDGAARIVGDGANRWSPVYRGDVARLYRSVVERRGRGIFHCAEEAARVEELAAAASRAAGAGDTTRVPVEEARQEMGALADALTMDQVVGCRRARAFGWKPEHPPFLESAGAVYREYRRSRAEASV